MDTTIVFNVGAGTLIVGIFFFFIALLAVVWKGKSEISDSIKKEITPFRNIANAVTEIQTVLRNKFDGLNIVHTMMEQGSSPLNPTEYGSHLIKESGLEKILDEQKEFLCTKLKAILPSGYTEYDVQEKARQILIDLKDDSIMRPVKDWVYEHPTDIKNILRTGGLWLRDDFLGNPRKTAENKEEVKEV